MILTVAALATAVATQMTGEVQKMETAKLTWIEQPGGNEARLTDGARNHWMMPFGPFSPDGRWIVFDERPEEGAMGQNGVIAKVDTTTGEVVPIYLVPGQGQDGPGCGTASFGPDGRIVFIHGVPGKKYEVTRRVGAMLDADGKLSFIDGRDVTPPYTPGALRGGSHAHEWCAACRARDSRWVGFTYNDAVMAAAGRDQRTVGVAANLRPVRVDRDADGENVGGEWFAVVVARVTPDPRPGSDEISRAFENTWVGRVGYRIEDDWQRAQAFIGRVRDASGRDVDEVFIADIPDEIDRPGPTGPLEGTSADFPQPPLGVTQRRLTRTADWKNPGVVTEPRHWLASSPNGRFIAFLARDDRGVVQIFLVRPRGGDPRPVTRNPFGVTSTIAWSPDSTRIAYAADGSVWAARVAEGGSLTGNERLTAPTPDPIFYPAWSPDGKAIAYVREVKEDKDSFRQIFFLRLR